MHTALRTYLVLLTLVAAGLSSGCRPPEERAAGLVVTHTFAPAPPRVGEATMTFTLADTTGRPVTGAAVALEGTMTHAGMQPVFSSATEVSPGRYTAPLTFTMSGDWIVLLEAALPDGRTLRQQVAIPGVQPP